MQMHLINTLQVSHDYAVLCKLQLFPAYYPGAKAPCLISSAWQLQRIALPFSKDPVAIQPLLFQGLHQEGLLRSNHEERLKQNTGEVPYELGACTFTRPAENMKTEAERTSGDSKGQTQSWLKPGPGTCSYLASRVQPTHTAP